MIKIQPSFVVPGGKENGVASVQSYFEQLLPYRVYYDVQETDEPVQREYPCVVIDQVDFFPDASSFMGDTTADGRGSGRRERLQMYFRSMVNLSHDAPMNTKAFMRRMRDQLFHVVTHCGVINRKTNTLWYPAIPYLDFSVSLNAQPFNTGVVINPDRGDGAIQDRFSANYNAPHIAQHDLLVRFSYITSE